MADTLREQVLAILEEAMKKDETEPETEDVTDSVVEDVTEEVDGDEDSTETYTKDQVDALVQEAVTKAMAEAKPKVNRRTRGGGVTVDIDKMTLEQRAKHYTDVVRPQLERESELATRSRR